MDYMEYVQPELMILIPVLYALGMNLKLSKKTSDNLIPAILTAHGIILALIYVCAKQGITVTGIFTGIVQGVLVAAAAVYTNQLIKQSTTYKKEDGE